VGNKVGGAVDFRLHFLLGTSMFKSRLNCRVMTELPNELVEVICSKPGICPKLRSSGAVTEEDITSGLAPG